MLTSHDRVESSLPILESRSSVPLLPSPSLSVSSSPKNSNNNNDTTNTTSLLSSSNFVKHNTNGSNNKSSECFTIKTSKKWVLPPRPKPGRKPIDSSSNTGEHHHVEEKKKSKSQAPPLIRTSNNTTMATTIATVTNPNVSKITSTSKSVSSPVPTTLKNNQQEPELKIQPQSKPQLQPLLLLLLLLKPKSKRGRKSNMEKIKNAELTNNPIKQAIMKINEENYYLKLEVIKLVSDLKSLKSETVDSEDVLEISRNNVSSITDSNIPTSATLGLTDSFNNQDISSVPMDYNSTSNRTINNNTIYKMNSNSSTNLSTPLMTTTSAPNSATTFSSPLTAATSPSTTPPTTAAITTTSHGKKRPHHDDEINDLILSLIDLNHTNETSPLTSTNLNSLHSEQIIEATVKKLNDKKKQQQQEQEQEQSVKQQQQLQQQKFNCTNFLNLDYLEDDDVVIVNNISSSPNHDSALLDDNDSIDIESLTPNSLLSLTKTNSTIDDSELDSHQGHHGSHHHQHFIPELIDIPEVTMLDSLHQDLQQQQQPTQADFSYEFSFWKSNVGETQNGDDKLKKNIVFNTNSTLDELIMERQREREEELLSYNEFNDLLDFENINNNNTNNANSNNDKNINNISKEDDNISSVIFNDDWRLDDDNLLNF